MLNVFSQVGISLCDIALGILKEFGGLHSEAKLKSTIKELLHPLRIYFNFDKDLQVRTLVKPRSRESDSAATIARQEDEQFRPSSELFAVNQIKAVVSKLTVALCNQDIFDESSNCSTTLAELQ